MSKKKSSLTIIVVLCCALSGVCQQVTIQEATNAAVNTMRYYGRNNISNSSIDSVYSMVNQVDLNGLPAGVYFVNITNKEGRKCVRKVVKE